MTLSAPAPAQASEQTAPAIARNQTTIRLGLAAVISGPASGSAFFVGQEGYLLTSEQVVGQASTVTVRLPTGGERRGEVVKRDAALGVVLIRILGAGGEALPIRLQAPKIGARLFAVGAPFEETPVTAGRVRGYLSGYGREVMRSDVKILPAGSGGPVLDEFGNIVAIANSRQGANLVPIMAALEALGLEDGKLSAAPSVTPAALRSPLPDSTTPDSTTPEAPAADGEHAAWDAIRRSRKQADYAAFLGAYPEGEFAELARKRAAVPENRLWDAAFAEPLPAAEAQRVLNYFKTNDESAKRTLTRYNERNRIAAGPNGDSYWVTRLEDIEVLDANDGGAIVKLLFGVHRYWKVPTRYIYRYEWVGGDLEPVRHQRF